MSSFANAEELLAATIRGEPYKWPLGLSVEAVVQAADAHGVSALVASQLTGAPGDQWPAGTVDMLRQRAAEAAAFDVVRERELGRVLERLAAAAVRPVLTKGIVLAHTHYAQPHLRPSFDVDLFVAPDQADLTARVFDDLGYRRSRQVGGHLVMPQFDYQRQDDHGAWHMYDVHYRAVNPQVFAAVLTYPELDAEAVPLAALGPHARGTSARHALLLACLHRVAHHPGDERLIWLYDIHVLVERLSKYELERLPQVAADKNVCGVVGAGLAAAREAFHTALPPGLLSELEQRSVAAKESSRWFIEGQTKLGVLLSDLHAVASWRERVRLVTQHVFPSSAYMLRRYQARSRALLPALYTHRLFTGAWRWLRGAPAAPQSNHGAPGQEAWRSPRA